MSDHRNEDWLDRELREDAKRLLQDQGFTSRVLAALPAPAARRSAWLKPALVLGSTAVGGLLASALAPLGPVLVEGAAQLAHFRGFTPSIAALLGMTAILAVAGWVLAED